MCVCVCVLLCVVRFVILCVCVCVCVYVCVCVCVHSLMVIGQLGQFCPEKGIPYIALYLTERGVCICWCMH